MAHPVPLNSCHIRGRVYWLDDFFDKYIEWVLIERRSAYERLLIMPVAGGACQPEAFRFDSMKVRLPPTRLCIAVPQLWEQVDLVGGFPLGLEPLLQDEKSNELERTNPRRELVVCLWSPPWLTPPGVRYCTKTGANQLCC